MREAEGPEKRETTSSGTVRSKWMGMVWTKWSLVTAHTCTSKQASVAKSSTIR
eukprot:m.138466 g.138466  ORF g.138466 m.138466 type:complete len:53 (+) comp13156_c0_seq7:950-1108(+)